MGKPKVAFVCVHNSCRSQMAEALGKKLAGDVFESYSGGTEVKDRWGVMSAVRPLLPLIRRIGAWKTPLGRVTRCLKRPFKPFATRF